MTLIKEATTRIRCAYCGLDHKIVVKVYQRRDGELFIGVEAGSDGCDVMDWQPVK